MFYRLWLGRVCVVCLGGLNPSQLLARWPRLFVFVRRVVIVCVCLLAVAACAVSLLFGCVLHDLCGWRASIARSGAMVVCACARLGV